MTSKSGIRLYLVAVMVLLSSCKNNKKREPGQQEVTIEKPLTFTTVGVYDSDDNQHLSFIQGVGHGGTPTFGT